MIGPLRFACGAAAIAILAGCNTTTGGKAADGSPTIRICDESGCSDRPANTATFVPEGDRRSPLLQDPDRYNGEAAATLAADGSAAAENKLGQMHLYGLGGAAKSPARAASHFQRAADAGHPWAQFRLAQMYADGKGVPASRQRSLVLLRSAAEQGHPVAAHQLGLTLLEGKGLPADPAEARRWFTIAAEGGVADAQYNLGLMLYRGQGGEMNLYQALQWMRRAAEGGNLQAQTAVGRLYLTGLDTMGQDLQESERWLTLASGRGDAAATKLLAELRRQKKEDEAFRRQLRLLEAETARAWANAVLASWLTAPRINYVIVW